MTTKKPPSTEVMRPVTPHATKPLDPEIDLPVGRAVMLVQVPRLGWTVIDLTVQGSKVLEAVVAHGPSSKAEALEAVKLRTVRHTFGG